MSPSRRRWRYDTGIALAGMVLTVLTIVHPSWIELIFRVDPDAHNGPAEWLIVAAFAGVTAVAVVRTRRRSQPRAAMKCGFDSFTLPDAERTVVKSPAPQ